MENLYIALVRAEEICSQEEWPNGLAVYYDPGSVSTATHETLSYCFLHQFSDGAVAVWSRDDCHLNWQLTDKAIQLLDQRRRQVNANLPDGWPHGIHPEMQYWAKKLYRLSYFEPDHRFVARMLEHVREGNLLNERQITIVKEIHQERGGVDGLRRRQHTQWRLMRLSALALEPKDREKVGQFTHFAKSVAGLRDSKLPVIGALENKKYWRQRLETTQRRAERIAAMLSG
jgi:hypothetical protein